MTLQTVDTLHLYLTTLEIRSLCPTLPIYADHYDGNLQQSELQHRFFQRLREKNRLLISGDVAQKLNIGVENLVSSKGFVSVADTN